MIAADHVKPLVIADPPARPQRIDAMLQQPFVHVVEEKLLTPQHAGQRLPHDIGRVFADTGGCDRPIKFVGLAPARLEDLREPRAERLYGAGCCIAQPHTDNGGRPGGHAQLVMRGGLGAGVVRIDRVLPARREVVIESVLDVGGGIGGAEETLVVGLVLGEQQMRLPLAIKEIVAEPRVCRGDRNGAASGCVLK